MRVKGQQSDGLHEKCFFLDAHISLSPIFSAFSARETPGISLPNGVLRLIMQHQKELQEWVCAGVLATPWWPTAPLSLK